MDKSGFNALDNPRTHSRCRAKTGWLDLGAVHRLHDDRCAEINLSFAVSAATKGRIFGVQATLASARLARVHGESAAIARLLPDLAPIMASEDAKEGLLSFIERRQAKFTGR
ncbi:MAG TPA: hypothetical protein VE988_14095 [Gemmataceae bacterium]|nr:hypothetical protein [Gemmataceae bacterium]